MTTSLVLQSVPLPVDCDLDESLLHTVSSAKNKRIRVKNSPLCTHIWKHVARAGVVEISRNVYALDLFHTWAQLSAHVSLRTLIVLGDAIITAMSRQPALSQGRDAVTIYHDLIRFVEELPHFKGRTMCVRALSLIMPGVDSPKESEERLSLLTHGIPQPVVNYVVPDMTFRSGAPVTWIWRGPNSRSQSNMMATIIAPIKRSGVGIKRKDPSWLPGSGLRSWRRRLILRTRLHVQNSHSMWHVLLLCEVRYSIFR